ncbi:DUF2730 domain-containing protein [Thauera sp. 2A1]|uniref:DUF2730 domain-containing protein n=1 Tax=Thauera sp. 2A1 TaxID=2570191 RepID=UPI0012913259|nr:DUF2730 domain-containing protein [Thauera sp. 2A1]KAI5914585.1 DUF2730 domain-containing protein [Thauera sp. 2A1]
MDVQDLNFSFEATRWLITGAIGIYSWLIGRQAASAKEMLELRTRITTLEAEIRQVPNHSHINELMGRLERVDARLEGVVDAMQPLSRSLDRINDYLLQHK